MFYSEYDKKKNEAKNKTLFNVPKKFEPNFDSAVELAKILDSSKSK